MAIFPKTFTLDFYMNYGLLNSIKNIKFILVLILYLLEGDGFIGIEEFRYDCVNRQAISDLKELDKAFTTISENGGVTR